MGPGWRRTRAVVGGIGLVLLLSVVLGLSVLTRFPQAPIVERAEDWPLVGPAARAFREHYLGPPPAPRPTVEGVPEVVVITREAREQVWVAEGAILRADPRHDAEALRTIPAMTNLSVIERRDGWAWVEYRGALGWVVPLPVSGRPGLGSRPSPVLPVPALAPDEELLAGGLRAFSRAPTEYTLGGYRMLGDAVPPGMLARCRDLEARLEGVYRETFRLSPIGEPAEVVLLYPSRVSYETFWRSTTDAVAASIGRTDRGIVATFVGDRSTDEVCATLVHELTHLVNRRAVGPALPPWLEEGIATEIAAELTGSALDTGLARLAAHRGTLPELKALLELDRDGFHVTSLRRLHYEVSGLWVRFLLEQEDLADRFVSFLHYLAGGGPYALDPSDSVPAAERETATLVDDLEAFLGVGLGALDARFERWLRVEPDAT